MPMNRPNPDAAAILALIQAGFLAEPPADPWAVNRLRQQSSEAATVFWAAYESAAEGCILAKDVDGAWRWIPATYAGQIERPNLTRADCSFSRAGVYRLDTGRPVWADVDCNNMLREHANVTVGEEEIIDEPLPAPHHVASAYASLMHVRQAKAAFGAVDAVNAIRRCS